jgi:hypothetical protein
VDQVEKAFSFAQETTKQLIALSTGVVTITITFLTNFIQDASAAAKIVMGISWGFYVLSILAGVMVLMALTGTLERMNGDEKPSIRGRNVTGPAAAQILLFVGGITLTMVAGVLAFL